MSTPDPIRAALQRLLELDPHAPGSHHRLGWMPWSDAIETARAALDAAPADGPAVPEGREPAAVAGQSAAAAGEVAKLVALIREISLAWESDACLLGNMTAGQLTRAAALLEQLSAQAPQSVAVSERLPGAEDCDAEGQVWVSYEPSEWRDTTYWELMTMDNAMKWAPVAFWLPAHALPLPTTTPAGQEGV